MTLSDLSIKRPVFAWMLMAALIIFGWISFKRMGISNLPDVDFPVISVTATYESASPEVMETDIVDIIEDSVMTVQGIRSVSSKARFGSANVTIEFDLNRDIDAALQEVQTKVAQAQRNLPKEMDPVVITKSNPEDQPIMWIAVFNDQDDRREMMRYVRDTLKNKFTTVSGVGEVFLGGYVEPNLRVWVSGPELEKYSLSVTDILDTIQNEHSELPAGQIEVGPKEYDVRTLGEVKTSEAFSNLIINQRGGQPNYQPIRLKQVAQVEEGLAEIRRLSRYKGKPAIGLGIRKQRGSNAVSIAQAVKARMEEIRPTLPPGMSIEVNYDTTQFIEDAVGELVFSLLLSALLTALVCWFFLGSWSSTLNILLAIPTSIIGAFTILYFAGFTLNTFTLLGLSLAIGIVVDDAIMVLENIVRHREQGESRVQAALLGANEITFAALAATIAIAAIFLPVAFMSGVIGKFFFQFGVTMTVTVFLSLLEALTLTPMRCAAFVEAGERRTRFGRFVDTFFHKLSRSYRKTLERALLHRWKIILASLVFFVCSFALVKNLKKEFVPPQDQGNFLLRIQTPIDSSIQYTDKKCMEIEEFFKKRPEVERYYVAVGGFGGGEVITGMFFITLKERGHRGIDPQRKKELTQQEFMEVVRQELKSISDIKVFLQDLSLSGFSASRGFPIEFSIRGPDWEKLAQYGQTIMGELDQTGLVTDVDTDYRSGKPEIQIYPDRNKAALHGVSVRSIAVTVNAMIGGVIAGKYPLAGHRNDIRVRMQPDGNTRTEQIKHLFVRNNRGELIPLSNLVTIQEKPALQQIIRYDRERAVTIFANLEKGKSQADVIEEVNKIAKKVLPKDYHLVFSGSAQTFQESFQGLLFALLLGILVSYMVLAAQFNSFIHPVTVLMALPFSVSGAFIALLIGGLSLNIYSFIGLILLMGIVKKNSILLVDFTNQIRASGVKDVGQALLEACPIRLRPILMTSFATVAAAIPPALAIGPGAEARIPMAVSVIGGVLVSTLLTLLVVPCVYSLFSKLERPDTTAEDFLAAEKAKKRLA